MNNKKIIKINWKLIGILVLTIVVFFPMFKNGFLNWDDSRYITNNHLIKKFSLSQIVSYFSIYFDGHYHPLTLISLAIDYKISGDNPIAFQITSMILHLINVYLVYVLIKKILNNSNWAVLVALLFGIHTMQVESVVWMSERKNLLYTTFFLSSLIFYLKYLDKKTIHVYLISILFFIFSVLSKVMAISLLPTLIIIDIYFKRNLSNTKVWLEKTPFLIIAIIFGIVAVSAQNTTWGIYSKQPFNFIERIPIASYSFTQYFFKSIIPYKLSAFYPYPDKIKGLLPWYFWLWLIPVIIYIYALIRTFKKNKLIFFGLTFFGVNIFLLLKLFEIPLGENLLGDRYVYIPSIGIFILIPVFISIIKNISLVKIVRIGLTICIVLLSGYTFSRAKVWKDDFTLFNDVIKKYPNVELAYHSRGNSYKERGEYEKAIADYTKAIQLKPDYFNVYLIRGTLYAENGNYENAINDFTAVISLNPKDTFTYLNRGMVYAKLKEWDKAIKDYTKAAEIRPDYYLIYSNRGVALGSKGDYINALNDFNKAIKINPEYPNGYFNRGNLWAKQNLFKKAINDFTKALQLNTSFVQAIVNRGHSYMALGNYEKAIEDFSSVIDSSIQNPILYYKRGLCYLQQNNKIEAKNDFITAQHLGLNLPNSQMDSLINKGLNK